MIIIPKAVHLQRMNVLRVGLQQRVKDDLMPRLTEVLGRQTTSDNKIDRSP